MAYAMADLGWKFYFINASWNVVFLVIAYFTFVETKGLELEEINAKFEGREHIEGLAVNTRSDECELTKSGGVVSEQER